MEIFLIKNKTLKEKKHLFSIHEPLSYKIIIIEPAFKTPNARA